MALISPSIRKNPTVHGIPPSTARVRSLKGNPDALPRPRRTTAGLEPYTPTPNEPWDNVRGNLKLQHDFRSVYASVLQNWFGLTPLQSFDILNGDFPVLPIASPCGPVSVEEFPTSGFRLHQNQPNPVRESTTIPFTISGGRASIKLFDMNGKEVATLADSDYGPGTHNVTFNPVHLSSGTYIYRLESRGRVESRTMVVMK